LFWGKGKRTLENLRGRAWRSEEGVSGAGSPVFGTLFKIRWLQNKSFFRLETATGKQPLETLYIPESHHLIYTESSYYYNTHNTINIAITQII